MFYEICIYFVLGAAALEMSEARLVTFCKQIGHKYNYEFRT